MEKEEKHEQLKRWYNEADILQPSDSKAALALVNKALDIAYDIKDGEHLVLGTWLKGTCLVQMDKKYKALETFNEAQRLHRQYMPHHKIYLAYITYGKGNVYMDMGNYELALNAFLSCLPLGKEEKMLSVYSSIASIYIKIGEYSTAVRYSEKVLPIAKATNNLNLIACNKYNIVYSYFLTKKNNSVRKKALELLGFIRKHVGNNKELTYYEVPTLSLLGNIYREERQFDKALEIQKQALSLAENTSNYRYYCEILKCIAKIYLDQEDEKNGLIYVHKTLQRANQEGLRDSKREVLNRLILFYKETNQLAKAFPFHEMLCELSREELTESRDKNLQKIITDREQEIQVLEEKNNEIEEQNAILKQFAYIISHDLREPIRGITGFAKILNNKYAQNLDKTGNEYLKFIISEAHSMNSNLARLLQYTTIEKNTDEIKEIDIQQVITKIQQQHQNESFQLDIRYEGVPIKMQHQHADLLLSELINNAVQFKKENEDCRVDIQCEFKAGYYSLSVKDYGRGIDASYHDKIFKIFNKINKWEGTGTGVGLAICERIVQLYKGEISVESVPTQYTIFHIKMAL